MKGDAGLLRTLAALEEVTIKVLPQPEAACTVALCGLDAAAAGRCLNHALASPHEASGAVYLPCSAAALSPFTGVPGVVALRLEGPSPSVSVRRDRLVAEPASR